MPTNTSSPISTRFMIPSVARSIALPAPTSSAPADAARPSFEIGAPLLQIGRRRLAFRGGARTHLRNRVGHRRQADAGAAFIQAGRIADRGRGEEAVRVPVELRAEGLLAAFEHRDAVGEIR